MMLANFVTVYYLLAHAAQGDNELKMIVHGIYRLMSQSTFYIDWPYS
jgi:hypothetical protein